MILSNLTIIKNKIIIYINIMILTIFSFKSFSLEANILAISDIHYDPLSDCPISGRCEIFELLKNYDEVYWENIFEIYSSHLNSKYNQDTNYSLLKDIFTKNINSINYIVKNTNINFLIANGDLIGHNLKQHYYNLNNNSYDGYSDFIKKTIKFIASQIKLSVSSSLNSSIFVLPILGNNDSYVDDYFVDDIDSKFYSDTAESWHDIFPKIGSTKFVREGFYSYYMDGLNSNIIVLNSNLFSENAKSNDEKKLDIEAIEQLKWLNKELFISKAKNQKVILAFHIPATVDPYSSSVAEKPVMFWKTEYQNIFLKIIKNYENEIITIFNSHIHSDASFVYSYNSNHDVTLFSNLIPSISPAHSNNPGFKIFHFSKNYLKQPELKDIDTYFYDISIKNSLIEKEYNFDQTYKSQNVQYGIINLLTGYFDQDYFKYYNLNTKFIPLEQEKYYICSIKFILEEEYNSCLTAKNFISN